MRCCVIGGAGFIGRVLTEQLLSTGREVIAIGRRQAEEVDVPEAVRYIPCDYANGDALQTVLRGCDEIIDLAYATVPKTSFDNPLGDLIDNLPPSIGLLETARRLTDLRKIIMVSSGGTVYGRVDRLPIAEVTKTSPVSPYGITKLAIENYALMFHRLHGLPITIARPANAYGIGQKPFSGQGFIATAMGHIARGDEVVIFGENGTIRDYVHVRDLALGIIAALDEGGDGEIYNIGSGIGRSNKQVLNVIEPLAALEGLDVRIRTEPARAFDVPANVLDFGRLLYCTGWLPKVRFEEGVAEMWDHILWAQKKN